MLESKNHFDVMSLFDIKEKGFIKIAAPMVRYSKLQFRTLVRRYDCDLCFTPMILADSFRQSDKARNNEFTTNLCDFPVITQFAANNVDDFVQAAKLASPYCNGIDLNCGCPQRWAKHLGIGCVMLEKPQSIYDIVKQCRNQICKPFTVSVKMRILKDLKKTAEICKQLEKCGVSFLTIHPRTSSQLTGDINIEALKLIIENVDVPVIANGGVRSLDDCHNLHKEVNCKGVMVANGLLTNPTLFTGAKETTPDCIQNWVDICFNSTVKIEDHHKLKKLHDRTIPEKPPNLTFQCFHHHLVFMLEKILPKAKRRMFNNYQYFRDVLQFLKEEFDIVPRLYDLEELEKNRILPLRYDTKDLVVTNKDVIDEYSYEEADGKYFRGKTKLMSEDNEDYGIGVMVANGLLTNPTLFTGAKETTPDCIQNWVNICFNSTVKIEDHHKLKKLHDRTIPEKPPNLTFQCFHHHLVFMLEKILPKAKRRMFNNYQYFRDVLQFLKEEFDIVPRLYDLEELEKNRILPLRYDTKDLVTTKKDVIDEYSYEEADGKYFRGKTKLMSEDNEDYGIGDIFIED